MYIGNSSKISIIDNSGVSKVKNIMVYGGKPGRVSNLLISSLSSVKPRRKIKRGDLVRSLIIQSRHPVQRPIGSVIRSVATRAILMKKQEFEPLANRLNGFFFIELRLYKEFRTTSLTVYVA